MTMSHSLEARVPFLDIDLIKFMLTVKSDKKIRMDEKFFLKEVSKKFLKNDIINRKKFYFPVPPLKIIKVSFIITVRIFYSRNLLSVVVYSRESILINYSRSPTVILQISTEMSYGTSLF